MARRREAEPSPEPRGVVGPLNGVRILDLTRYMAGPYGTMLLAHLGAEVIKVEEPKTGDPMRQVSLYFQDGLSAHFVSGNVSKKSLTLNLRHPEGRRIFLELVARADIVVENFRPGTMAKLGLDYERLRAVNPRIILGSISGFGQTGPWRDLPSFDLVAQAVGGGMSLTGEPGKAPVKMGIPIGDLGAGVFAALGLVAALYCRETTGQGEWVDVGMMDVQLSLLNYLAHYYWASGNVPGPEGAGHPNVVPYQIFWTPTGYLAVAVYGDHFWTGFCRALELSELIDDPRFASNDLRCEHRESLIRILEERIASRPREDWMGRFAEEGIPAGPVYRVDDSLASPQARARQMVVEVKGPSGNPLKLLGAPFKFQNPGEKITPPPTLGQHTLELLRDLLGYADGQVDALRREGVI
ncbi:MAG: CoA transferase [Candidatus Rokubacteria bacterium]|nr:CoA transferase [Candidatus Rokubacteria bacterium]